MLAWDRARIVELLALAIVLVVGGYLRLALPDLVGFAQDQARDADARSFRSRPAQNARLAPVMMATRASGS